MGNRSDEQYALLTDYDRGSTYSEAFYMLFATVRSNWKSEQTRQLVLLVTSPANSSEQATASANLAIAAAQSNTPTILVDTDVRNPGLQQRFGLVDGAGLSDLLAEEVVTSAKIGSYLCSTFISGLRVLCVGDGEARAGLSPFAPKLEGAICNLRRFLAETETQPGIVLLNCAPVLTSADASLISALADQTFLVVVTGRNTRTQIQQAREQLQHAHAHLSGVIMTKP